MTAKQNLQLAAAIIVRSVPDIRCLAGLLENAGQMRLAAEIRRPKRKSPADKAWPHPYAIELDAIPPDDLRRMVRETIESYLPADQLQILKVAEGSERELIQGLVAGLTS
jgi:hypothetical protein